MYVAGLNYAYTNIYLCTHLHVYLHEPQNYSQNFTWRKKHYEPVQSVLTLVFWQIHNHYTDWMIFSQKIKQKPHGYWDRSLKREPFITKGNTDWKSANLANLYSELASLCIPYIILCRSWRTTTGMCRTLWTHWEFLSLSTSLLWNARPWEWNLSYVYVIWPWISNTCKSIFQTRVKVHFWSGPEWKGSNEDHVSLLNSMLLRIAALQLCNAHIYCYNIL